MGLKSLGYGGWREVGTKNHHEPSRSSELPKRADEALSPIRFGALWIRIHIPPTVPL